MALFDLTTMDLANVQDAKPVKPDQEYQVRITEVKVGVDKNGYDYIMPRMEVVGEPTAKDFTYFLGFPGVGMDPKSVQNKSLRIKKFCEAFGINLQGQLDPEALVGSTAWCILGLEDQGEPYGETNYVKKWLVAK